MKPTLKPIFAAGLLIASAGSYAEDTLPLKAVNKANEVIDAVIEAYGGAEAISGLNSITRKTTFTNWAVNQSRKPEAPWDETSTENFNAINFEDEFFYAHTSGDGGGFTFDAGNIINGEESYQLDYRNGTAAPVAEPDFNTTSGPVIRVTAPLLVKQLQNRRQTSHWLGEAEFQGRKHDIITLVMEVGPALSLYVDQETHLLSRSERVLPPFGQVEYRFVDQQKIDGIPFSKTFELYVNGDRNLVIDVHSVEINKSVEQYAAVPANLTKVDTVLPQDLKLQEIDEGVFLVGGTGTYALFVEMEDYVVAVGGTAGIPDRIKELRTKVQDKPIKYGVLTHHHSDHVPGVAAYLEEGATVLTVKEHEAVVRNAAGGSEDLKIEFVDGKKVLNGGSRRIELHDIGPTPHTEHLIVAWLPDEGILFEADHFSLPASGPIGAANGVTVALAKAIDERGFDVKMIIGAHSPRIGTREDLNTALAKRANPNSTVSP
jgi:glyoxylase-like metal-dependent hydrolase (beta-lactamase superfamily II)